MENLVDKIIEIDKVAEEKMKVAEQDNVALMQQIEQRKQEIIDEINKNAKEKLNDFESAQQATAQEEMSKLEQEKEQAIEKLQKIYQDQHDHWTDQLVERILKK